MLLNKKKRIKYLGFNDTWFMFIGIIILSFIIDYIFNNSFVRYSFGIAIINWGISLFFSLVNWFLMRRILIYLRKRYPSFQDSRKRILTILPILVMTILLIDYFGGLVLGAIFGQDYHPLERFKILIFVIVLTIMTMAIYEAIYFYVSLKKSIREEEQSKQAIVQAELDALRNQAQPHFFFNTLNTLRDIIDQNSKEEAKEFVDKLSEMYRFLLESGSANLIFLKDELKFAKAYVHIQAERFGDNLQLNWDISEATLNAMIVPMSLQLLLENAIKHNVISKAKPLKIHVIAKDNTLLVSNQIQPKSTQLPSTKVGLKNIEQRYSLISCKRVEIKNEDKQFTVTLPLLKA
ncbi:sensor histidine kinase [Ascidiimonas sp. W6]|uniref:sensor histidine kinase n=1 Tax=Ascidiimonas meishanensis TaxID=3128903 RepID=UPI0030EBA902